jgi:hypothetical protein
LIDPQKILSDQLIEELLQYPILTMTKASNQFIALNKYKLIERDPLTIISAHQLEIEILQRLMPIAEISNTNKTFAYLSFACEQIIKLLEKIEKLEIDSGIVVGEELANQRESLKEEMSAKSKDYKLIQVHYCKSEIERVLGSSSPYQDIKTNIDTNSSYITTLRKVLVNLFADNSDDVKQFDQFLESKQKKASKFLRNGLFDYVVSEFKGKGEIDFSETVKDKFIANCKR